jgi:hypothetical protein
MPKRSRNLPRDTNARASAIVKLATGETDSDDAAAGKNPAAVALGRLGGLKGGKARAAKLTKKQRSDAASDAAKARWKKAKRAKRSSN